MSFPHLSHLLHYFQHSKPLQWGSSLTNKWKFRCHSWQLRRWCRWTFQRQFSEGNETFFVHTVVSGVTKSENSPNNLYTDQVESYLKCYHRTGVSTRTANPESQSQDCDLCIYTTWPRLWPAEKPQMYHHLLSSLHLSGGEQEQEQEQEENGKNSIFSLTFSLNTS